jgi:hypothetical protein
MEEIDISDIKSRGAWNIKAIKDFILENHKPKKAFKENWLTLYKQFYNGDTVIRYGSYYTRKHILDTMAELKIKGLCTIDGDLIKIGFLN